MTQRPMRWLAGGQSESKFPNNHYRDVSRHGSAMRTIRWLPAAVVLLAGFLAAGPAAAQGNGAAIEGDGVEVAHVSTCLAGNGRVDTNIVNQGSEAATYRIEFGGLSARESEVAAGDWWRMPITGRSDGDYPITVKRTPAGGAASVISTATVQVQCDTSPPQLAEPEIQVVNSCRDGDGFVLFQFANNSASTKPYVIEFEGVNNRSTTAAAFGGAIRAVTGRPDDTYVVKVRSRGVTIAQSSISVICDGDPAGDDDPVPASRRIDWSASGIPGGIPVVAIGASVTDFGATANDASDDTAAFQAAIDSVAGSANNAVSIPAGTFNIGSKLQIGDSAVLRGAGSSQTHLVFSGTEVGIEAITYQRGDWVDLAADVNKDSTTIEVADASGFQVGGFFEIEQENDPAKMYTDPLWEQSWSEQSVGQIGVVTAVDGNTLTLREPLNIDFSTGLDARVRTQGLVSYVGIEDLHLDRSDNPGNAPSGAYTVHWKNAAYTWMSGVESEFAQRYHIGTESVYRCEVRDSYFHHAHDYGGGGNGYGINLGRHVTGCLVEDNVFHTLRHSMLVQVGANGNVLGYNYSFDSRNQDGNVLPDIALHGHYPFANLFEGNVVEEIGYGDWWGPAGPHNTSLRNCVTVEGLWYRDASHGQNIVGNELTDAPGNYVGPRDGSTATDLIVHGNYFDEDGRTDWDPAIASRTIPDSYYLSSKPSFYGNNAWPSTGSDVAPNCSNPASKRFAQIDQARERAECVVASGGAASVADFAAMRANGAPAADLNRSQIDGVATSVRAVFELPESRMRWGSVGVELAVDVADPLAVDYRYRAELRETVIDQAIPVGTTQAYCMRFDVLESPDLFGPVTIFQRFNRDVDGPDISVELTGANQFSNAVSNDLQVVAFGERLRIGDMLDGSNTLLVVVHNDVTDGAYKVVLNGRVLAEASGIDTVGSPDGGWVQFGLYPHGFYGDVQADTNKADQIDSGSTEVRVAYIDFAITNYPNGITNLAPFDVTLPD